MNKIKQLSFVLITGALLASCGKADFKKTPGGMPYQLFKGKDTQTVKTGNYLKVNLTQKINDSVYYTTNNALPLYIPVTGQSNPYDISELWTKLHIGDSVVATQMMDTFIRRLPAGSLPPQFKKGDRIMTYVKVLGIFTNDSTKIADEQKGREQFSKAEIAVVEKFVNEKKITTQKTPSGVFVEIMNPGTGNLIDSGKYVSLNYTGTTFQGKKFDSNLDPAFGHVQPLSFTVGNGEMIKGFDEAMRFLRPGATAKIYVPSLLAYGPTPPPGSTVIKPYENLVFELVVTDVKDKAPAAPAPPPADAHQNIDMPQQKN
ncbi:MAG: FKBP-type peptidyl-prolyl cis-trans isomerase [Chitinophagales bacterium]|nr:FKBP-type peptidyl-prolyl cis-trans isomerase [Chitinophagales bacterium]